MQYGKGFHRFVLFNVNPNRIIFMCKKLLSGFLVWITIDNFGKLISLKNQPMAFCKMEL